MPMIGVLGGPSAADSIQRIEMFQQSLREFGYRATPELSKSKCLIRDRLCDSSMHSSS